MNEISNFDNCIHVSTNSPMNETLLSFFDDNKVLNIDTHFLYTGPNIIPGNKQTYYNYENWINKLSLCRNIKNIGNQRQEVVSSDLAHKFETFIAHEFLQSIKTKNINMLFWIDDSRLCDKLFKNYLAYFYELNNIYFIDYSYINTCIFPNHFDQKKMLSDKPWSYRSFQDVYDNKNMLTHSEIKDMKKMWKNTLNTEGYIRIFENGVLHNKNESYFDESILEQVKKEHKKQLYVPNFYYNVTEKDLNDYIKLSIVYSYMMGVYELSDIFVLSRLIQLIEDKKIEFTVLGEVDGNLSLSMKMLRHYFIKIKP